LVSLADFIRAEVDLGFLDRAKASLRNVDLRPAWKEIRKPFRADLRQHARRQEGPDGTWTPMSSRTRGRARAGRKRPRKLLGRLPGALTTKIERRRLLVSSLVSWSGVHQDGGRVGRGAKVPARPFLWASDKVLELASKVIAKGVALMIGGR
jgi:phage gpG-like protein